MTSATDQLGAHLLGRRYVPDARDYPLAAFLAAPVAVDPLDQALADMLGSWEGKKTKAWAKIITARVQALAPSPAPTPTPAPQPVPTADVTWNDTDPTLDQGQTPHCVGFGCAQWGNTLPVDDHFDNPAGDALYYEAKVIDGEPNQEDGSTVRSGAKALQNRGRLHTYAFAASLAEVIAWVDQHGPVIFGTDWYNDMFTPDPDGLVHPTGGIAGGHCYVCVGDLVSQGALLFHNSWGDSWGDHGLFHMKYADVVALLAAQGDACAAVELP